MSNVCPICKKDDALQKLSSIASSGSARGSFSGSSVGLAHIDGKWGTTSGSSYLSGTLTTDLAKLCAPPKEPVNPRNRMGIIGSLVGTLPIMLGIFMLTLDIGIGKYVILGGLATLPFLRWASTSAIRKYDDEQSAWALKMAKYNKLYYCFRDDAIFNPESIEIFPPADLADFLKHPSNPPHVVDD